VLKESSADRTDQQNVEARRLLIAGAYFSAKGKAAKA